MDDNSVITVSDLRRRYGGSGGRGSAHRVAERHPQRAHAVQCLGVGFLPCPRERPDLGPDPPDAWHDPPGQRSHGMARTGYGE
jgi:hypothetical protein